MLKLKSVIYIFILLLSCQNLLGADRYWIATSTANWNSTANWSTTDGGSSGASVPGSGDVAIFTSSKNGACTINAAVNVLGFSITTYTGTITQGNFNITVGASGFVQNSGVFTGNTSTTLYPIVMNGIFTLSGGTFTENSYLCTVNGTFTQTGGTFNAKGTLAFRADVTITGGTFRRLRVLLLLLTEPEL